MKSFGKYLEFLVGLPIANSYIQSFHTKKPALGVRRSGCKLMLQSSTCEYNVPIVRLTRGEIANHLEKNRGNRYDRQEGSGRAILLD